jgi:MFS family permease
LLPEGSISPVIILFGTGVLLLLAFAWICTRREHHGKEPLVPTRILFNRVTVAGLIVQAVQWFLQLGVLFVITVFVQQALGLNAIQSGVTMVPAIIGLMLLARRASPLAEKYSLRWIMQVGFVVAEIGILLVMLLADDDGSAWRFVPGLFLLGAGVGLIMPASVTFVQSTSPEADQSAISGVSRAASNLGSSLGTAVAGSVLVVLVSGGASYERGLVFALLAVGVASLVGFVATFFIPGRRHSAATAS